MFVRIPPGMCTCVRPINKYKRNSRYAQKHNKVYVLKLLGND